MASSRRPPQAPLLSSRVSNGPDFPGGYPRDSVVFATNAWEKPAKNPQGAAASEANGMGLLSTAKSYLPQNLNIGNPASYFSSAHISAPESKKTEGTGPYKDSLHTPHPPSLNTDGTVYSDFSTRAFLGSSRSTTPVPSDVAHASPSQPSTPGASVEAASPHVRAETLDSNAVATPTPQQQPVVESSGPESPRQVVALPSVAPFATAFVNSVPKSNEAQSPPVAAAQTSQPPLPVSPSTSSSSSSSGRETTLSPPSSPEVAPPHHLPTHHRFTLRRKHGRDSNGNGATGHAKGVSVDFASPSGPVPESPRRASLDEPQPQHHSILSSQPKRSWIRNLRGEVKVLSGRMRHDQRKIEEGRKMMSGDAA
ncbi:unnamed protein product [Mycena citricolor]|uniref:Uncharacterized protein n=1 Tax=Mycena citricolor TaxID=2018698 RepID=A0AAD2HUC8_9AGAR|nr:unnamed protein product [Mycena citricolor]